MSAGLPPDDFKDLVALPVEASLIGGQAVNLWALVTFSEEGESLKPLEPFQSKDVDVLGDELTFKKLKALGKWTHAAPIKPKPGQDVPVVGVLVAEKPDGSKLLVEVRRSVRGLQKDDLVKFVTVTYLDNRYTIMEPHIVLKAKLANFIEIAQEDRQDGRHIRILIPCIRAYIRRALSSQEYEEDAIAIAESTLTVVTSEYAQQTAKQAGIDFRKVVPNDFVEAPSAAARNLCSQIVLLAAR